MIIFTVIGVLTVAYLAIFGATVLLTAQERIIIKTD